MTRIAGHRITLQALQKLQHVRRLKAHLLQVPIKNTPVF